MAPRSKTGGVSDKAVNEAAADSSGKAVNAADAVKKPGRKKSVLKTEPAAESDMAADSVKVEEKKAQSKKAAAKKEPVQTNLYVQFADRELRLSESELAKAAEQAYENLGSREGEIREMDIYVKPEEGVVYYAVNGQGSDEYKIVL